MEYELPPAVDDDPPPDETYVIFWIFWVVAGTCLSLTLGSAASESSLAVRHGDRRGYTLDPNLVLPCDGTLYILTEVRIHLIGGIAVHYPLLVLKSGRMV